MKRTLVLIAYLTLLACGEKSGSPNEAARHYWAAVQQGDQAAIKLLSVAEESKARTPVFTSETKIKGDKIREISYGETTVREDYSLVSTTIIPEPGNQTGRSHVDEINFDTRLIRVEGQWKVDKTATDKNMMAAAFAAAMGVMGDAFSEGMQQAVEGIGEALSEGMKAMAEGLAGDPGAASGKVGEQTNSAAQNKYVPPVVLPARVSGSIRDTRVELSSAEWSNTLAIYSGSGWGSDPSLLVFLFLGEGEVPAARTITVKSEDKSFGNPHVHYRWRDPQSGDIKTEVVTGNYDMVVKFGEAKDRRVSGEIRFSVPEENTRIEGTFEIELKQ